MQGLKRCIRYWTWIGWYYILSGIAVAAFFGLLQVKQKEGIFGVLDSFSIQVFLMGFAISVLAQVMNGIYVKQSLTMGVVRKNCFLGLQYHNLMLYGGFYVLNLVLQKIVEICFGFSDWTIHIGNLAFAYFVVAIIAAGISNLVGLFIIYHERIGIVVMTIICALVGGAFGLNVAMMKEGKVTLRFPFPQSQHAVFWILLAIVVYVSGSIGQYVLLRKYEIRA